MDKYMLIFALYTPVVVLAPWVEIAANKNKERIEGGGRRRKKKKEERRKRRRSVQWTCIQE